MGHVRGTTGLALAAIVLFAAAQAVSAQHVSLTVERLLAEGDSIPNGVIDYYEDVAVSDAGSFWSQVRTAGTALSTLTDGVRTIVVEGAPSPYPGLDVVGLVDVEILPGSELPLGILALNAGPDGDRALVAGGSGLIREGDQSRAPEVAPGTLYASLLASQFVAPGACLLLVTLDENGVLRDALVRVELSGLDVCAPEVASESVLVRAGDLVPASGGRLLRGFGVTIGHSFAANRRGDTMFVGDFDDAVLSVDRRVVLNDRTILRVGQQLPGGTGLVTGLRVASVDLDDQGGYVIQAKISLVRGEGDALLVGSARSGQAPVKLVQSGDPVPDPRLGNFHVTRIGRKKTFTNQPQEHAPVFLTPGGDVVWYGEWDDPAGGRGLFVNQTCIVKVGDPLPGFVLSRFGGEQGHYLFRNDLQLSPNGRFLLFVADDGTDRDILCKIDLGAVEPYGTPADGCTAGVERLEHHSGLFRGAAQVPSGFPLVGSSFRPRIEDAPAGTTTVVLGFTLAAPATGPCGPRIDLGGGLAPFEYLLGPGTPRNLVLGSLPAPVELDVALPAQAGLVGLATHAQAFFLGTSGLLGGTTALRITFGAP